MISSFENDLADEERRHLRQELDQTTLIRFRVKAGPFLMLGGTPRERVHRLPAHKIKDVNDLLLEKIEVLSGPK